MKKGKTEHLEMSKAIVESMTLLLGHNSLHDVLKALSKGCMVRCREMLNADTPKDINGNTLRALLDFSERIDRLSDSARSHNPDHKHESRATGHISMSRPKYKDHYREVKLRRNDEDDIGED